LEQTIHSKVLFMTQTTTLSKNNAMGRRGFLKTGCLTIAGVSLACVGGGAFSVLYQPEVNLPAATLGPANSARRVLIAYASKAGSTAEMAARMGEEIARTGAQVDVKPVGQVTGLNGYQSVVLGSAIRMGSPLPEAMRFVEAHQAVLQQAPFHVFIGCMTLNEDTPENRVKVSAYLDPLRAVVKPASEGLFAGKMDMNTIKLYERLIILAMKSPQGDFRRWDQVTAWAKAIG
jgi:menaquinone-dependent protoporphyrinogen oxidase